MDKRIFSSRNMYGNVIMPNDLRGRLTGCCQNVELCKYNWEKGSKYIVYKLNKVGQIRKDSMWKSFLREIKQKLDREKEFWILYVEALSLHETLLGDRNKNV